MDTITLTGKKTPPKCEVVVARTGWVLVHPRKGVNWHTIDWREDRPGGLLVALTAWRWQRVIVRLDGYDEQP